MANRGVTHDRRRLDPPTSLSRCARRVFKLIVKRADPVHFVRSDEPLIAAYATTICEFEEISARLAKDGLINPDGKPHPLLATQEKLAKTLSMLALRLRLAPSARLDRKTAGTTTRAQFDDLLYDEDDELLAKPDRPKSGLASFPKRARGFVKSEYE